MPLRRFSSPATVAVAVALLTLSASRVRAAESAQQLIREVVFNELSDHRHHGYFQYRDQVRNGAQVIVKAEVETSAGRVNRVLATDGVPLNREQQQEESHRLDALLHDPAQQQRLQRDYQGDEDRIARIVSLLPDGFLFEYEGADGSDIRLRFRPNPEFKPPTYEARVFHAMAGSLWIDAAQKRLTRLQGALISNVDFGYGLLGRLDRGGTFNMERIEATEGNWKTRALSVHISGHVVLLKSIGKNQDEIRSEFRPVPPNLTLQQAKLILGEASPGAEERSPSLETAALRLGQRR